MTSHCLFYFELREKSGLLNLITKTAVEFTRLEVSSRGPLCAGKAIGTASDSILIAKSNELLSFRESKGT
jgi:hypothetical protein